jgi:hypothetical protein
MQIARHAVLTVILSLFLSSCSDVQKPKKDRLGQAYSPPSLRFKTEISEADYARIRTGGISETRKSKTIIEFRGSKEVSEFITPLRLYERQTYAAACECDGDPTIEIYKGDSLITSIAIKHGASLYWPDNWPGEMLLDADVFDSIAAVMTANGFPKYEQEKRELRKLAEQLIKEYHN